MAGLLQADTGLLQHPPGSSAGHATGLQQGLAAPVLPPPASQCPGRGNQVSSGAQVGLGVSADALLAPIGRHLQPAAVAVR
jgi:hypothetical protein